MPCRCTAIRSGGAGGDGNPRRAPSRRRHHDGARRRELRPGRRHRCERRPGSHRSQDSGGLGRADPRQPRVPILQGIISTGSSAEWEASPAGLSRSTSPGRWLSRSSTGASSQCRSPSRRSSTTVTPSARRWPPTGRAGQGRPDRRPLVRLARLSRQPAAERKIAIVLSAYPTRRSRLGNAVGLDTAASLIGLLAAFREAGYRVERTFASGDALMAELADGLAYESETLDAGQLDRLAGTLSAADYRRWFEQLPAGGRGRDRRALGGSAGRRSPDALRRAGLCRHRPRRGARGRAAAEGVRGEPGRRLPLTVLPPTHHYVAFYRWLESSFGASAVVHLGKARDARVVARQGVGLSKRCAPDLALGELPFVYPFVVNDPGRGPRPSAAPMPS